MSDYLMGSSVEQWLANIGVSDAPLTRAGLVASLQFLDSRMPLTTQSLRLSSLKGIDLHKPVRRTSIAPPMIVAAFRQSTEDPFRLFFTKAGTPVGSLGLNPTSRSFRRFRVTRAAEVLESRCADARDTWTTPGVEFIASGGGVQYIIPDSGGYLELVR